VDDTYDVTGEFPCAVTIDISWSFSGTIDNFNLNIEAPLGGASLFSTAALSGSSSFSVPGGTNELNIRVRYWFTASTESAMTGSVTMECP